jgi:hypothetical protein
VKVRIDAPLPNGKLHKSVITVLRDDGRPEVTDRADLYSLPELQKAARRLAKHLDKDAGVVETALREALVRALEARPRGNGQAPAGVTDPGAVNEAGDDPHYLARLFIEHYRHKDGLTLLYWRAEWFKWDGRAWRHLPDKDLNAEVCALVKQEFDRQNLEALRKWQEAGDDEAPKPVARKVTGRIVSDVLQALASLALLPSDTEEPSWLERRGAEIEAHDPSEILVCTNGMGHLATLATEGILEPCTPRFFSRNALDYAFDPQAPPPRFWLEFLEQLWPKDVEAIQALQEFFGYALTGDTRQQKILMLVGPRRSGKGTIARVLRAVVGLHNVCSPTLAGLGTNFGLWPLLGKTLAIISDARLSGRTDAAMVVERLLSISGEDAQTIDRKNLPHVNTKLPVRFVLITSELPKLSDPSGGLTAIANRRYQERGNHPIRANRRVAPLSYGACGGLEKDPCLSFRSGGLNLVQSQGRTHRGSPQFVIDLFLGLVFRPHRAGKEEGRKPHALV